MSESIIEDICMGTIMTFCENLAELGCPREAEPDMWFRTMSYEDQIKVVNKMFEINDRNAPPIEQIEEDKEEDKEEKDAMTREKLNTNIMNSLPKDLSDRNLAMLMSVAFHPDTGKITALKYNADGVIVGIYDDIDVFQLYNGCFKDRSMRSVVEFHMVRAKEIYDKAQKVLIEEDKNAKDKDEEPYKPKLRCLFGHDWVYDSSAIANSKTYRRCRRCNLKMVGSYDPAYGCTDWVKIQ